MASVTLRFGDLSLQGSSRAGDRSWFRVQPPGLAFDCGRGAAELTGAHDFFLTHGHLDHALGLPFALSQRGVHGQSPTRVFCPAPIEGELAGFIEAAARLEGAAYRYSLRGLVPGEQVEVGRGLWVEAFSVDHVVPALGYHLVRERHRLAAPLRGLPEAEVAMRRRAGEPVDEVSTELWLSYPGDTGPRVFELEPRLFRSRVLLLECTFLDAAQRPQGELYKHLHFDDLVAHRERFENEALVLCHLSRRFRAADLRRLVDERLPTLAERVRVWDEGD